MNPWVVFGGIAIALIAGRKLLSGNLREEEKGKIKVAALQQGGFAKIGEEDIYLVNSSDMVGSPQDAVDNTVMIETIDGLGSGYVVLTDKGWAVVTNWHVIRDATATDKVHSYVKIKILNQDKEELGKVIRFNAERDVALISFPNKSKRKPVKVDFSSPSVGESVYVIGTPLAADFINTVTEGIISAVKRKFEGLEYIQSDVTINNGNSGGPLFLGRSMRLVGMAVSGIEKEGSSTGINLFIPIRRALSAVNVVYSEREEDK